MRLFGLFTAAALFVGVVDASAAPNILTIVPTDCSNTHLVPGIFNSMTFPIGPPWVGVCDSVCSFGETGNLKHKDTIYFARKICSGTGGNTVTPRYCVPDLAHRGCNKIIIREDDPDNHVCGTAAGLNCRERPLEVTCEYIDAKRTPAAFRANVGYASCVETERND